jgi:hypothetical protein
MSYLIVVMTAHAADLKTISARLGSGERGPEDANSKFCPNEE